VTPAAASRIRQQSWKKEEMMLKVFFCPIRVLTDSEDRDGCLVLVNEHLAGVLIRLSAAHGIDLAGQWFLEVGFGRFGDNACVFDTLDSARLWVHEQASRGLEPDPKVRCRVAETMIHRAD
jgi:hypothetical protein